MPPVHSTTEMLISRALRWFFQYLYHDFSWTYDSVASLASLGRWNEWIQAVVPFVRGPAVLELGHGTGHLQEALIGKGIDHVVGLDESAEMGVITRHRLTRSKRESFSLSRGLAQRLPFSETAFDTVVATFPTEYIFEGITLAEVRRVLKPGGEFLVLPAAWIVGRHVLDRLAAWGFRITYQAPEFPPTVLTDRLQRLLESAGFHPSFRMLEVGASVVLLAVAS